MSKAVITIIDGMEGAVSITIKFTPAAEKSCSRTPAQYAAMKAMEYLVSNAEPVKHKSRHL